MQPESQGFPLPAGRAVQPRFSAGGACAEQARPGGPMVGRACAFAAIAAASLGAGAHAQDRDSEGRPDAAEMISVAREVWRSPGLRRRCAPPQPGEIVVCAPDPDEFRVESPTDEAIRKGERPPGMPPNAMHLFDPPPCVPSLLSLCSKIGKAAPPPPEVDLSRLPVPLTPEEAAHVFRADDAPAAEVTPAEALPAAVP